MPSKKNRKQEIIPAKSGLLDDKFTDGVYSLVSSLQNQRNALNTNTLISPRMGYSEMRSCYITGVGSKIINIKADYALRDSITFKSQDDKEYYEKELKVKIKKAIRAMIAFGRGVIVIVELGKDQSKPLSRNFLEERYKLEVFSGDLITAYDASFDLMNKYFYKPKYYSIRGFNFHESRVIDFSYKEPPQYNLPEYQYGGVSEFQIIREQLITNGIVERSAASILEKNSTFFYKVEGFKDLLNAKKEATLVNYFGAVENNRSIYGAGLLDLKDEAFTLSQSLTDIDKVDNIVLRRLAMVTDIPITWLVGENAQGMNSTGDNEMDMFWWMIKNLREEYIFTPFNKLMELLKREPIKFKERNDMPPKEAIEYDEKAVNIAHKLWEMGEDGAAYLQDKGVIPQTRSALDKIFTSE